MTYLVGSFAGERNRPQVKRIRAPAISSRSNSSDEKLGANFWCRHGLKDFGEILKLIFELLLQNWQDYDVYSAWIYAI
jgi:hypothetical protein